MYFLVWFCNHAVPGNAVDGFSIWVTSDFIKHKHLINQGVI